MSWNDKDNKNRKKIDKDFVSCDEKYELEDYIDTYGKDAVEYCCKKVNPPRKREDFEKCLKNYKKQNKKPW